MIYQSSSPTSATQHGHLQGHQRAHHCHMQLTSSLKLQIVHLPIQVYPPDCRQKSRTFFKKHKHDDTVSIYAQPRQTTRETLSVSGIHRRAFLCFRSFFRNGFGKFKLVDAHLQAKQMSQYAFLRRFFSFGCFSNYHLYYGQEASGFIGNPIAWSA